MLEVSHDSANFQQQPMTCELTQPNSSNCCFYNLQLYLSGVFRLQEECSHHHMPCMVAVNFCLHLCLPAITTSAQDTLAHSFLCSQGGEAMHVHSYFSHVRTS